MTRIARLLTTCAGHAVALRDDEGGATAIEYALVASGVAVAIAATVFSFGSSVKGNLYEKVNSALN
jgi:pilus assembly protein Flp/PilA